jgi:hypothetical protein
VRRRRAFLRPNLSGFAQLPGLRIVMTAHAIGGLAMAAGLSGQSRRLSGTIDVMRKHVFIDTTLVHPALFRASVDLLGAGNVVAGSDWPIAGENPIRGVLADAVRQANLSDDEQKAIAAGNSLQLLGIGHETAVAIGMSFAAGAN